MNCHGRKSLGEGPLKTDFLFTLFNHAFPPKDGIAIDTLLDQGMRDDATIMNKRKDRPFRDQLRLPAAGRIGRVANRPTSFAPHPPRMFRPNPDVAHMVPIGIDLSSHDEVKANAAAILERLRADPDDGMMPPAGSGGPWPEEWIALFERWINEGMPS